jgi:hypothetical protein
VPAGQQVPLQPALAGVFGQQLHHPAGPSKMDVHIGHLGAPDLVRHIEHRTEPVRLGLVRPDQAEVAVRRVRRHHVAQPAAEHPGRLGERGSRGGHLHAVRPEVRQLQVPGQPPAVGVRVGAHPQVAGGQPGHDLVARRPGPVEQLLGPVGAQPRLQRGELLGVGTDGRQRYLVGPPGTLDRQAVEALRAGPALRRTQHDHRPARAAGVALDPGPVPDRRDRVEHLVQCGR